MTELEVAEVLPRRSAQAGCDEVIFTIVGAGAERRVPHHHTGKRVLEAGDAIVIDIGGRRGGYSPTSRGWRSSASRRERYLEVHAIVEAACRLGSRPPARARRATRSTRPRAA